MEKDWGGGGRGVETCCGGGGGLRGVEVVKDGWIGLARCVGEWVWVCGVQG